MLTEVPIPSTLDEVGIQDVSCGYQHTAIILNDGSVYVCGDNSFRQCGPQQELTATGPSEIAFSLYKMKHIQPSFDRSIMYNQVHCGWFTTCFLCENRSYMYGFGQGMVYTND